MYAEPDAAILSPHSLAYYGFDCKYNKYVCCCKTLVSIYTAVGCN